MSPPHPPESARRVEEGEEDGARGAGRGGVLDAQPGEKRKKVEVFSFLPSHFENFGGRPQRGNVTETSLLEIEFAFVFLLRVSQDPFLTPERHSGERNVGLPGSDN